MQFREMGRSLTALALVAACGAASPKHILHIIGDDLGWAEVSWHRSDVTPTSEVQTPHLQALVDEGLELDRFYAHKICSPSRCALQSGRAPIHVNVQNVVPEVRNKADPVGGFQGIPTNMTCVGQHLQRGGFRTHFRGKWDVGMATPLHHPRNRGFDSWLGYWHHANDYWSHVEDSCGLLKSSVRDLWLYDADAGLDGPARALQNGESCSQSNQAPGGGGGNASKCEFEEALFTRSVQAVLEDHAANHSSEALFLVWSMHLVHMPLQVPQDYLDRFAYVDDPHRRLMHAMVAYLDDAVGKVVGTLKSTGLWEDTLVVFHADNGGEILGAGVCGGNNWPLRGGKFTNWEGGVRVNAFVSGGALPVARRGQKEEGLVTIWDWYATYAGIAGVDPTDHAASAAGLPPIDSIDVWPLLAGANSTPPRTEIALGDTTAVNPNGDGDTLVGGVMQVLNGTAYKLILGTPGKLYVINQDTVTGPLWPNSSSHLVPTTRTRTCGRKPKRGCLFDVMADPLEERNLGEQMPDLFASMLARIDELQKTVYSPKRGSKDDAACKAAEGQYGGYWGPWVDVAAR